MSRTRIINLIGLIFIIFLTIVYLYFSERFSVITTGFGGLVCITISAALVFYKPMSKPKE